MGFIEIESWQEVKSSVDLLYCSWLVAGDRCSQAFECASGPFIDTEEDSTTSRYPQRPWNNSAEESSWAF